MFCGRAQVSRVAASVPPLTDAEYSTMLAALNRALAVALSPLEAADMAGLHSPPRTLDENFAFAELGLRRVVRALRELPDFRELPLSLQTTMLKVCYVRFSTCIVSVHKQCCTGGCEYSIYTPCKLCSVFRALLDSTLRLYIYTRTIYIYSRKALNQ